MQLTIYPARMERSAYDAQLEVIKRSGASYDGESRVWWLHLDEVQAHNLNPLFQAAKKYGTQVVAE